MNYTGRPSISGCRPVLPLYPTHRFCQYLLLIFITFTNSFLFNRAFSTNSRRPLRQRLSLWESWRGACDETERARPLTANPRHSDSIALTKSLPIAAQRLFPAGLALSVTFGDTSPKGRGFGRPYRFLYLFGETCGIMGLRPCPPILFGREVRKMESILSFILSVGANVAAYYICKWLDGWFMGRKH